MAFKNGSRFFSREYLKRTGGEEEETFPPPLLHEQSTNLMDELKLDELEGEPKRACILYTQQSNIHRFRRCIREDMRGGRLRPVLFYASLSVETKALSAWNSCHVPF